MGHAFLPDEGNSIVAVGCMLVSVAINHKNLRIASPIKKTADFLLRTGNQGYEEDLAQEKRTTLIEVRKSSSEATDNVQYFFTQADKKGSSRKALGSKKQFGKNEEKWWANGNPFSMKTNFT